MVVRLTVFGSGLRDDFSEKCDRAFVVVFGPSRGFTESRQFFGFAEEFEALSGRKVDLVDRKGIKIPYFKKSLEEQGVSVFAA